MKSFLGEEIVKIWGQLIKEDILYLPVLGPVYVSTKSIEKILNDLFENRHKKTFLSYDKNRYWFKEKNKKILFEKILQEKDWILVPVLDSRNHEIRIFYFGNKNPTHLIIEKSKKFIKKIGVKEKNVYFFSSQKPKIEEKVDCRVIFLKRINNKDLLKKRSKNIFYLKELSNKKRKSLDRLKQEKDFEWLPHLIKKVGKEKKKTPVICAVQNNNIVGIIGPLRISQDAWGNSFLYPPFFSVRKKFRRKGYGTSLWKQAMSLAFQKGATYLLVQNKPDSPALKFYKTQGLKKGKRIYSFRLY